MTLVDQPPADIAARPDGNCAARWHGDGAERRLLADRTTARCDLAVPAY